MEWFQVVLCSRANIIKFSRSIEKSIYWSAFQYSLCGDYFKDSVKVFGLLSSDGRTNGELEKILTGSNPRPLRSTNLKLA
jgi:hypothetical protein